MGGQRCREEQRCGWAVQWCGEQSGAWVSGRAGNGSDFVGETGNSGRRGERRIRQLGVAAAVEIAGRWPGGAGRLHGGEESSAARREDSSVRCESFDVVN